MDTKKPPESVVAWATARANSILHKTPTFDLIVQIRNETLLEVERLLRRQAEVYMKAWLDRDIFDEYVPPEDSEHMRNLRERVAVCDAHRRHVVGLMNVPPDTGA